MEKTYFFNRKSIDKNKKKLSQASNVGTKRVVDINVLLNKVKIEERNETKRKFFFISFVTLTISLLVMFVVIIK